VSVSFISFFTCPCTMSKVAQRCQPANCHILFSRTRRPQQHITQGWVDYQQLFHFPICCQQISIHTHVPIINLIYIQLHDSLNKHVNIVYWQNCANKCKSQHHDISSVLLSCFPEFNVPYEECSALTFNSAQRNQLQDTVSDWEYAFVTA
jgi:hypothetical protein